MPDSALPQLRRVLMTADGAGAIWPYTLDLSRALAARGITVRVAVMGPSLTPDQRADAASAGVDIVEGAFTLEWMDDAWGDVDRASGWLLELEKALQPDVIHLNGYCHGALPWRAPVVMVGHSCVRSWWNAVHHEEAPARWDEYRARVRAGLLSANLVIAPTRAMLDDLTHHYGPLTSTAVIPHGRSLPLGPSSARQPIVFTAGELGDEARNLQAVCAAARDISWPVYIAGDGRHPASECAVPGAVHHLGRLKAAALRGWYSRASIYALPARYEPFGLSVLEAALCGCAMVLGDIRSLRENWSGAALFVPPDNRRALSSAVQSLIDSPSLRDRLTNAAQARAQHFTVEAMAEGYCAAYARAIARPATREARPRSSRIAFHAAVGLLDRDGFLAAQIGGDSAEAVY